MPKLSDTQLEVVPGATGERRGGHGLIGDRLRHAMRGGACLIPTDEADPRRLARTAGGQYVDPHDWHPVPNRPGWLACSRCPTVTTTAELVACDERYAAYKSGRGVLVALLLSLVAGACSCEVTAYKNNEQTGCECPKPAPAAQGVPDGAR